jgi:hypothetical protein
MHYGTRSHRMQKHMFSITCLDMIFVESIPIPPEHQKLCVDILHPRCTETHYVTHRSHDMQKYMFGVTCLDMFFVKYVPVPPEDEK